MKRIVKKVTDATKKADAIETKAKIESKKPIAVKKIVGHKEMKVDKKTAPDVAKKEVPNKKHEASKCHWKKFKHRSSSIIAMNTRYSRTTIGTNE